MKVETWQRTVAFADRQVQITEALSEHKGVVVELEWIGEGRDGDYDPDDSSDEMLLRFSVHRRLDDGTLEAVDDASYCTALQATSRDVMVAEAAKLVLSEVGDAVRQRASIKKACERLSWIGWKHSHFLAL